MKNQPRIVAHRGASHDEPENTLEAFQLAWDVGADGIEGDFHLTSDGHVVCIHDRDTKRVGDSSLVVADSTLAELRQINVGQHHENATKPYGIPSLEEVLATIPEGKKIYIEIKCGVEIIAPLLDVLKKSGLKDEQIVMITFHAEVIEAYKKQAPEHQVFLLCGIRKNEDGHVEPSPEDIIKSMKEIGADGLSSGKGIPEASIVDRVLAEGFEFHVWTVDDVETAERLAQWGALSITTNVPKLLKEHFSRVG